MEEDTTRSRELGCSREIHYICLFWDLFKLVTTPVPHVDYELVEQTSKQTPKVAPKQRWWSKQASIWSRRDLYSSIVSACYTLRCTRWMTSVTMWHFGSLPGFWYKAIKTEDIRIKENDIWQIEREIRKKNRKYSYNMQFAVQNWQLLKRYFFTVRKGFKL